MPTVEVPGARLTYDVAGNPSDPAVVFIHAGVATRVMWDPQFHDLAHDHFVVRYDTRGFGESPGEDVPYANRDDLIRILDTVGLERAVLVGCSRGGGIALDTALEHPDRVAGLVTIGSTPSGMDYSAVPSTELERQIEAEMERVEQAQDLEALIRIEVQYWDLGPERGVEDVSPEFMERAIELNTGAAHWDFDAEHRALVPPAVGRLGEIRVPALVVVGDFDVTEAQFGFDLLTTGIRGAEGVHIPDSAHLPSVEHPDRFTTILREFLAKHSL
jgi:pimeloyl-ACP methyl ester carboxylesterase